MWRWMTVVRGVYDAPLPEALGAPGDRVRAAQVDGACWEVQVRGPDGAERWCARVPAAGWEEARRRIEGAVTHRCTTRSVLGPTIPPRPSARR